MESSKSESEALICRSCGDTFTIRWSLLRHERMHAGTTYPCVECDKVFSIKSNLVRHKKIHHTDNEIYLCSMCGLTFKRKDAMLVHEAIHNDICVKYHEPRLKSPCEYEFGKDFGAN